VEFESRVIGTALLATTFPSCANAETMKLTTARRASPFEIKAQVLTGNGIVDGVVLYLDCATLAILSRRILNWLGRNLFQWASDRQDTKRTTTMHSH